MVKQAGKVSLQSLDPQRHHRLLERWLRSPHVARWWGNPGRNLRTLDPWPKDTQALIVADSRPVGYLCWERPPREALEAAELTDLPENLVDIDIMIGEPEYLGCGIGTQALLLLLARLHSEGVAFAGLGPAISNHAAIRAYEKAGFRVFRSFDDPEDGPCQYMVVKLPATID